jgi:hypothetical protein
MWMRFFLLLFPLLLVTSCHKPVVVIVSPTAQKALQNRSVPAFNQVRVEGTINVNLHTGYRRPQVVLFGNSIDLLQVKTEVINNTLFVRVGNGYPKYGPLSIEIRGQYLNKFNFHGSGNITGTHLRSSLLDLAINNDGRTMLSGEMSLRRVDISGQGYVQISGISSQYLQLSLTNSSKVELTGVMNITHLDIGEKAWLALHWVRSHALIVRGRGQAFLQLAGIVGKLDVELWGRAHFNGRYLRANRAFVKTHDKAIADISAINHQHTLATDASDIYFYNIPTMKTDFMAFNGSVLDMRDWNPWDRQVYTRYNK